MRARRDLGHQHVGQPQQLRGLIGGGQPARIAAAAGLLVVLLDGGQPGGVGHTDVAQQLRCGQRMLGDGFALAHVGWLGLLGQLRLQAQHRGIHRQPGAGQRLLACRVPAELARRQHGQHRGVQRMRQRVQREAAVVLAHRHEQRDVGIALEQGLRALPQRAELGRRGLAPGQALQGFVELPDQPLPAVVERQRRRLCCGRRPRADREDFDAVCPGAALLQLLHLALAGQHLSFAEQQPALRVVEAERHRDAGPHEVGQGVECDAVERGGGSDHGWLMPRAGAASAPILRQRAARRADGNHANTPAVSPMRALTSPSWCRVSPKLSSSAVSRLKQWLARYSSVMPMPPCNWMHCWPT